MKFSVVLFLWGIRDVLNFLLIEVYKKKIFWCLLKIMSVCDDVIMR